MLVASSAHAKPSNPAFLGIGMRDLIAAPQAAVGTGVLTTGPCIVDTVTRGSGAKAAGLQPGDILHAIDSAAVSNCDAVLRVVQAHEPGDTVKIKVQRYGRPITLTAQLVSRDEILRRRLVGQPIIATELHGVDEDRSYDLSSLRGKTTIVGWFDARRCDGCGSVFTKLADWARRREDKAGIQAMPLAVTIGERPEGAAKIMMPTLDVPLALAEQSLYEEFTIPDAERINFMVIDCRGIVQYVAPVVPNGDDTDAVLDELFAAAEQASRRTAR